MSSLCTDVTGKKKETKEDAVLLNRIKHNLAFIDLRKFNHETYLYDFHDLKFIP